jgi:phage terminase large subunit-like protein
MNEMVERNKANTLTRIYKSFYQWQRDVNASTAEYQAVMLMAANQVGKTRTGCTIDAHHLTGVYPDDWEGREFTIPPLVWLLGVTGEKTRDLLQHQLFGRYDGKEWEGGLIAKDLIVDYKSMSGTSGAMREVRVKHANGVSTCQFWSYSQGQHVLMGDKVSWYHIDEEPEDSEIFPQVITRTLNGDGGKGGAGILTFTPENGMTQLVCKFMGVSYDGDDEDEVEFNMSGMKLHTATWDDAPHISEKMKENILAIYPAYQKLMRSKGVPLMGSGLIYPFDEDEMKCDPFEVPDYWFVINGMDFGWNHPQAHIQLVWDRDADIFYLINAWKGSKKHAYEAWHIVKPWAENVPTAWPSDGLQTRDGKEQKGPFIEEGFKLLPEHAQWETGGNSVEAGIVMISNLLKNGKLKVVRTLLPFFDEFRQYHATTHKRTGKVTIHKVKDDLLDALRIALMMKRYAIRVCDLYPDKYTHQVKRDDGRDKGTGY